MLKLKIALSFIALTISMSSYSSEAVHDTHPYEIKTSTPNSGLFLSTDHSGGIFSEGATESFTVINASSTDPLTELSVKLHKSSGFQIVSNNCPSILLPRKSCHIQILWAPLPRITHEDGSLEVSVSDHRLDVSSHLFGEKSQPKIK